MRRVEESIVIKCPVDKVFAYAMDLKSVLKLHSNVIEVEQTSPGQMGVGTTFQWGTRVMGRKMKTIAKVTEYELNKRIGLDEETGSMVGHGTFFIEPVEGGTKFTQRADMKLGGFFGVFSPLSVLFIRKGIRAELNDLKNILESQT
jgi:hypothetical protein